MAQRPREQASRPLFLGPRIKRLRRELGLTQQTMAEDLDISPSYVALIERNQRPLTADVLLRLARSYKLDMTELAADARDDYAQRLVTMLKDPIFAEIDLTSLEIADIATSFPGVAEAMLRLHGAYAREQQALAGLREGTIGDPAADAAGETRRFFARAGNHFASLDARATALSDDIAHGGGQVAWLRKQGIRVRFLPGDVMMGALRRYDRHGEQLLIDDALSATARQWQIALHIGYTAMRAEIAALVRDESFAGATAAQLVRRALAAYAAAAMLMPQDRFARAAEARGYDIDTLAGMFGVSFEQVAHRLTSLPGVPFFFLRVDAAGNVSKRLDGAGFPFAAQGGGCPLWNVHRAIGAPHNVLTQWLELPDGQRFFSIARAVVSGGGAHDRPTVVRAMALVCGAEHAPKLVYAHSDAPPAPDPDRHDLPLVQSRTMYRARRTAAGPRNPARRFSPGGRAVYVCRRLNWLRLPHRPAIGAFPSLRKTSPRVSTIIPLADVDPELVEALLDTAFEPTRHQRTAYRLRDGTELLPALSFAALDDSDMLAGTIQCWPLALTDPTGRRHPMIMVGPVAVMPALQGKGYGQALVTAAVTAIDPRAPLPQVLIGDPDYYGRFFGFSNAHTGAWDLPGPFERHRLLCRTANPAVLPPEGTLGPWLG